MGAEYTANTTYGEEGPNTNWRVERDQYLAMDRSPEKRQQAYCALFRSTIDAKALAEIRSASHKGWALGDEQF